MESIASQNIGFSILILVGVALFVPCLSSLVNILPMLLAGMFRAKENITLHNSAKLIRRRNSVALAMIIPFVVMCARYGIYPPAERLCGTVPIGSSSVMVSALVTFAAFFAYLLLRFLCNLIFAWGKVRSDDFACAREVPFSFFILMALIMAITIPILSLCGTDYFFIKGFLYWEICGIYALCIIRRTQIFIINRGILAGILYICGVEILPTGMLVASCMLF